MGRPLLHIIVDMSSISLANVVYLLEFKEKKLAMCTEIRRLRPPNEKVHPDYAAMRNGGLEPEEFVNRYNHKKTYLKCYGNFIEPLNGPHLWEKTGLPAVLPPIYSAQVGRKKENRRLGIQDEKESNATKLRKKHQNSLKCGKCRKSGHNQRSCKAEGASTSASKRKGKAGRPRKAKPSRATTSLGNGVASSGAAVVQATWNSKLSFLLHAADDR
ncbi:hypothetical protein LguiA_012575 [Lonicera macranthoides]